MQKQLTNTIFLCLIFVFAFFLRVKFFIQAPCMWHDECSLGVNIFKKGLLDYFGSLDYMQSAPPLFMELSKSFVSIFGAKEWVFRLIPFISAICSIPIFYIFSKKFITNKAGLILANFLFAINYHLLMYTGEFKQYSSDILFFMITFLILDNIKLENYKKIIPYSILFLIISQFSLPVIFLFAGFIFSNGFNKEIIKKEILLFSPSVILIAIYSLLQSYDTITYFKNYWNNGFITFTNIIPFIKSNFEYWFSPNNLIIPELTMFITGIICLIKKQNKFLVYTFFFVFLASVLKIYPLLNRVGLYLIPSVIVIMLYSFNFISTKKKFFTTIIIIIALLSFRGYNISYAKQILAKNTVLRPSGNVIMQNLAMKYNKNDIVLMNLASVSDYDFFTRYYNFFPQTYGILNTNEYSEAQYYEMLDKLPSGTLWFYFAYDYSKNPVIPWIKQWKTQKEVLFELHDGNSYLLYINKN